MPLPTSNKDHEEHMMSQSEQESEELLSGKQQGEWVRIPLTRIQD